MGRHRCGAPPSAVECGKCSNHRMLSLVSSGTRVGLIFRFKASVPLKRLRVQPVIAPSPSGPPPVVTTKREGRRTPPATTCVPQALCVGSCLNSPIAVRSCRLKLKSVVSWSTNTGPSVAATRARVAWKWPARISRSLTRALARNRYAAEGAWRRVARARAQVPRSAARRVPVSGWLA